MSDSEIRTATFPLPIGAVLLEMDVELAGKKLSDQIVERVAAEARYEDAITDGDSAVMVQDTGNGLYTMNVGNLMARETPAKGPAVLLSKV